METPTTGAVTTGDHLGMDTAHTMLTDTQILTGAMAMILTGAIVADMDMASGTAPTIVPDQFITITTTAITEPPPE